MNWGRSSEEKRAERYRQSRGRREEAKGRTEGAMSDRRE